MENFPLEIFIDVNDYDIITFNRDIRIVLSSESYGRIINQSQNVQELTWYHQNAPLEESFVNFNSKLNLNVIFSRLLQETIKIKYYDIFVLLYKLVNSYIEFNQ